MQCSIHSKLTDLRPIRFPVHVANGEIMHSRCDMYVWRGVGSTEVYALS